MKILLVIPTLKQGGAESVMSQLANQWAIENYQVHLVLLVDVDQFYKLHPNITIHNLGFKNINIIQKIFSELKTVIKLRQIIISQKPNYVLSFMDKYNILTIIASRFIKTKNFISDRSNPRKKISTSLYFLKKITYKYADGIIAQTSLAKEIIYDSFKNKNIKIIPNPLKQLSLYPEIRREKIIINVGRMVPEKGQKHLLDAFSNINDLTWKLVILGDGPLNASLVEQIKKLGIENRVVFPGVVRNVDKWLAKSSIFAFSSISEGFPNALIEAMSAGLPVVSFDCDAGPRDIIENSVNGFLVENRNVKQLTEVLNNLTSSPELRNKIGNNAKGISTQLNIETISKIYLEFFKQIPN